jgi:hypothetical protein
MDEYLQANQIRWDRLTAEHENSPFYDLEGFKAGKDRLRSIELSELGDVSGKTLLHLQCHFGLDSLAWARQIPLYGAEPRWLVAPASPPAWQHSFLVFAAGAESGVRRKLIRQWKWPLFAPVIVTNKPPRPGTY